MTRWYDSRYTGLFRSFGGLALRPHDPAVSMTAAEMPPWHAEELELGCGGAGWTQEAADLACLGEGLERILARALPCDRSIRASWDSWPLDEPAVEPSRWVLFHPEQYAAKHFPFVPLGRDTVCRWVSFRAATSGAAYWVPEEMIFLMPRRGECQRHLHGFSTGLSCGNDAGLVLLRGLQEVIERDALVGGWWGRYRVEEWPAADVRKLVGQEVWHRIDRPNLRYRFYRVNSPFSSHVTLVSQSGQDAEGWIFSVGSACRQTRSESWQKAILEAIQGRHCVRRLIGTRPEPKNHSDHDLPKTFFEHALYYARRPERLSATILERASPPSPDTTSEQTEGLAALIEKLGPDRPVLFRNLTPPFVAAERLGWLVLRVIVPGLQPLHGDHGLPFLGGTLWQPRTVADWAGIPPHPFA